MKLTVTLFFQLFFGTFLFSQIPKISSLNNSELEKEKVPSSYDSLQNFLGKNAFLYKGQTLLLMEKAIELRQYGYMDFVIDYNNTSFTEKSNIYKCCSGMFSNYDKIAGKYFKVVDVIQKSVDEIYLKLEQTDTKEICYFIYLPKYGTSFPFTVVGFYEKLKRRFIGKKFVLANKMIDDNLKFKTGDAWKCIDVAIIDGTYDLSVVLQNDVGSKTSLSFDYFFDTIFSTRVIPLQKAEIYKRKFGISNWNLILQTNVAIGMTKEMAIFSWGEPEKINSTITANSVSEQWVYDGDYLYFRNGKLYALQ